MSLYDGRVGRRKLFARYIKQVRISLGWSTYQLEQNGIIFRLTESIETASANYTIDSLLKYLNELGLEIYFAESNWKKGVRTKKDLAEYCTSMREQKEFKRYHFRKLGFSQYMIEAVEKGSKEYTIDTFLMYCTGLGVELRVR